MRPIPYTQHPAPSVQWCFSATTWSFDREGLLEQYDRDVDLLAEVCALHLRECERLLESIRRALALRDFPGAARAARELYETARTLRAGPTAQAAERVAADSVFGGLSAARHELTVLEGEVSRLTSALTAFVAAIRCG